MPVTTGIINASSFKLFTDPVTPVVIADQVEISFEASHDLRDITTKDSGAFEESAEGLRSVNASCTLMYKLDSANGIDELKTAFLARTLLKCAIKTANADDPEIIGDVHIYSISEEAGVEDNISCDVSFGFTGAVTFS
jgi:hypothetical protein